jgi:hypothetical protein
MAMSDLRRSDLQAAAEDRRVGLTTDDTMLSNRDCFCWTYRAPKEL